MGFVVRTNIRRVGGVLDSKNTHNEDAYLVGTKTITYFKALPIVAICGFKATNASVLGIAGMLRTGKGGSSGRWICPSWSGAEQDRGGFGVFAGASPYQGLPGAGLPTTLTYFARVIPRGELPWNVDFGVAQVANRIAPGVELHVRSQFAFGISYRF